MNIRPATGVKFSKSAACLNPSFSYPQVDDNSSQVSDTSANTLPLSMTNRTRFSDYHVLSVLGQGSFGKVYHVIPKITTLAPP